MNESLRGMTRRLAETMASEEGALTLARMQRLALAASRAPAPLRPDRGLRLGIWEPHAGEDGSLEFARAADTAGEWRYWADVGRIPRKSGPRAVLVGESVARAYLFDPAVTLAGMLAAALRVEVVDLARTDLTAEQLPPLFDALPALDPDAIVLFAGNNWSSVRLELEELDLLAGAVRDGGFARSRSVFVETLVRGPRARHARGDCDAPGRRSALRRHSRVQLAGLAERAVCRRPSSPTSGLAGACAEARAGEMIALDGGAAAPCRSRSPPARRWRRATKQKRGEGSKPAVTRSAG